MAAAYLMHNEHIYEYNTGPKLTYFHQDKPFFARQMVGFSMAAFCTTVLPSSSRSLTVTDFRRHFKVLVILLWLFLLL
jgi:hypothetical protein